MEKCKYSDICKYYRQEAHTCQDDREASEYCGVFGEFKKLEKR